MIAADMIAPRSFGAKRTDVPLQVGFAALENGLGRMLRPCGGFIPRLVVGHAVVRGLPY